MRNFSKLKRAQQEPVGEVEDLLAHVFASIQEGLLIKDQEFRILRINPVIERWFAHILPLVGKKCYEAIHGRSQPCEGCPTIKALETGEAAQAVVPKMGPGGEAVGWLDLHSSPLVDATTGKLKGVIEFLRDVTERKHAEEALRESEQRFRLLVRNIPAVVFKGYADWTIDFFDDKIEELTGYKKEEFDSRRIKWSEVILPEDLKKTQRAFLQALKTTKSYVREYRIKNRAGKILWIQARGQIFCDPQGKVESISGVFFDITGQKQVEEALRESEAKYRTLVEQIPAMTYVAALDEASTTLYISPQVEVLLGFSPADYQADPDIWRKQLHPEDRERVLREVARSHATGEPFVFEYRMFSKSGRVVWFKDAATIVRDPAGQPLFLQGVMMEITAHKEMEEALRKSEARLAEAQRIAHLGNWEWHIQGNELHWSDEIYRIFGLAPQEFGATYEAFLNAVHPNDREVIRKAVDDALYHGKPYSIGHRIVLPNGWERYVYEQGEVTFDEAGRPLRMVGTVQDITASKQAQEALHESEKKYRLLAENVIDVIWSMDLDLKFTYVTPSVQLLTGYSPEEFLTMNLEQILTPASLEVARKTLAEHLALENLHQEDLPRLMVDEVENIRKDGSIAQVEVKASVVRNSEGRPVGIVGVTRDITARRQLEAQLRQAQKMEVVGRLAGGVAHDFNNLLTAILGYSELLLHTLGEHDPLRQDVAEIKKSGERAAWLTRQLLAFSRRQILQPKLLDLNYVVENMGKMLKRVIGEDVELVMIPDPGLGRVMADPGQIEQVILNLAVNARDAMHQGGKLILKTANVEMDEAYAQRHVQVQPGPYVMLAVTDTGCGMDAATKSQIFEPFFTTKEVGKGTGLGLSTVYGIIRQSGGYIWVYSEPGRGTTFKIYLPLVQAALESAIPSPLPPAALLGKETILLVEDEEVVRQIVHRILKRNGYDLLQARDGAEALLLCEQHQGPIHLLVTDLVMPGMSGQELARRLATLRPEMKVLFISGYAESSLRDQGVWDQRIRYLQKPFAAQVLLHMVRQLLDASP